MPNIIKKRSLPRKEIKKKSKEFLIREAKYLAMLPIHQLLNKIKWDERENPENYSIFYLDRVLNKLIEIPYTKIKKLEGSFMILDIENLPKVFGVENRKIFNNEEETNSISQK